MARGRRAWGICDKTGFRYLLKDLVFEYKNGKRTGMRVGRDVADKPHPQEERLRDIVTDDPRPLHEPRPDTHREGLFGWAPVGNPADALRLSGGYCRVTITTNVWNDDEIWDDAGVWTD